MSILDLFGSSGGSSVFGASSEVPSIDGIGADLVSVDNIANGRGKSQDYGAGIGAGVGAFFGAPEEGSEIGRVAFPILNQTVRPLFSNLWNSIAK